MVSRSMALTSLTLICAYKERKSKFSDEAYSYKLQMNEAKYKDLICQSQP